MVVDEFVETREQEEKLKKAHVYNIAYLTALFVGSVLGGKQIPSYEDVYQETAKPEPNKKVNMESEILKEKLRDFAREANKRRK